MNKLWRVKEQYEEYSSKKRTIAMTFGGRRERILCYERLYKNLNQEQLQQLLKDAKENEWDTLDLSDCGLEDIPDELWDIKSLKVLFLGNRILDEESNNYFSEIPEKIEMLENLEALSITNLKNVKIPKAIKTLPKLAYLDCFRCGFERMPNNMLNKNIKCIGIDCDTVEQVAQICQIGKLEELYLSGSKIEELPREVGDLKFLKTLWLVNSKIEIIPESLLNLRQIRRFDISGTPLALKIPEEIRKQTAYELISYICKQQNQQKEFFFNESKMIIVGQGNVGKSCLLERIINDRYEEKESTLGIAVKKWTYYKNRKSYTLNVWDFGGQEIYHSTHQFFLTKRSLYVFVWDARAEEEYGRIDYWLKTIESFADDSPIIICINKCDKDNTRINRVDFKAYKEKYPQITSVLDISCKDNLNIGRLKNLIKNEASGLKITKEKWLKSWYDIRKEIEALSNNRPYITYDEFRILCQKHNVGMEEGKSLSKYLHDLGVILHYQSDPFLKNIVILSPSWATAAVYKILDSQETVLRNRNGVLLLKDLPLIWTDSEMYPEDKYIFMLKIMEKFQLCFEINRESFLVAELLENTSIDCPEGWNFNNDCCIGIVYRYDFMPAGVMTRFIVRIHDYIANINGKDMCWKKGVYLTNKTAYARVVMKDSISEKSIEVKVSKEGNFEQESELLHAIRNALKEVNSNFSKIKIEEFVPCNCSPNCKFMFSYSRLCDAIDKKVETIQCHDSFKQVNIIKLLEGIDIMKKEEESPYTIKIYNDNKPVVKNEINIENKIEQTSIINIKEAKKIILEMQGDIEEIKNDIMDELPKDKIEEVARQLEKIKKDLEGVKDIKTPEELVTSGKLNKLKRWLKSFSDEDNETRKALSGAKDIMVMVGGLIIKFNELAEKLGIDILSSL